MSSFILHTATAMALLWATACEEPDDGTTPSTDDAGSFDIAVTDRGTHDGAIGPRVHDGTTRTDDAGVSVTDGTTRTGDASVGATDGGAMDGPSDDGPPSPTDRGAVADDHGAGAIDNAQNWGEETQVAADNGPFPTPDAGSTEVVGSDIGTAPPVVMNPQAIVLIDMINDYREENGKPRIPISPKLNLVGATHVANQLYAKAANTFGVDPDCNGHSWYDQPGQVFTSCCYTKVAPPAACMWKKPSEIANFNTNGFEISFAPGPATIEGAFAGWKNSPSHNAVMLNQGDWALFPFNSIGAGVDEDGRIYHVWFATGIDPESP